MNSGSQFKIFISHRHEDQLTADTLAKLLEGYSGGRVSLWRSSALERGDQWIEQLRTAVGEADLLLLLVTSRSDLSSSWDWSLYEVGLFTGSEPEDRPIVALVAPDTDLPAVTTDIQSVPATEEGVTHFLTALFREGRFSAGEPVNADVTDAMLREIAVRVADSFRPPVGDVSRMHASSLVLTLCDDDVREEQIPEHAMIEANGQTLRLFGLLEGRLWTWGDLTRSVQGDKSWLSELGAAVQAILEDRLPGEIYGKLLGADGLSYSPIMFRDERRSSGVRRFHLLFRGGKELPVDPTLVFVISAFRQETETAFEAIQAAANHHGLEAKRVKDEVGDYRITNKIIEMIQRSRFLVADLTHERPNVYFELGYARGLGKTVVTTARKGTQVHFDVKDWTYLEYDDSRTLERDLVARLSTEFDPDSKPGS